MKVYVVVPYKGRDRQAARTQYFRAKAALEAHGYQVAAALDKPGPEKLMMPYSGEARDRELYEMGKHLMHMSCCDAVYPVDGWDSAPECVAEVYAAEAFGLRRLEAI